jgi:hypothetical protein
MIGSKSAFNFQLNKGVPLNDDDGIFGSIAPFVSKSKYRELPQSPYDYPNAWRLPSLPLPLLMKVAKFSSARQIYKKQPQPQTYTLSGITRDLTGAILPNCVVNLFATATNAFLQTTTSDANGAYTFSGASGGNAQFVVSYKVGTPDVAGTTINQLYGS